MRRWSWAVGFTFASASGLLLAPLVDLTGISLTLLVVQAFGAAAVGRFSKLPATYVGGLLIGIGASLSTKYFRSGLLASLAPALPFLVLFAVLIVARKRSLVPGALGMTGRNRSWTAPSRVQLVGAVVLVAFLATAPLFSGVHITAWTLFLAGTIAFLSLGLLVRVSGQVSLCQVTFTAIGAAGLSHLAVNHGMPWLVAVLLAGAIAVPIGVVLAVPAIRLSGLYLALATFGFGLFVSYMFYSESFMFGNLDLGLQEPRPHLSWLAVDGNTGYYYVVLAFAIAASLVTVLLTRGRMGRLLRAQADSPSCLATCGSSVDVTLVVVFAISAFMAGVSGALAASAVNVVTSDSYQPLLSLTYFTLVVIVFGDVPWYAVTAAAGIWLIPSYLTSPSVPNWLELLFGVVAVVFALTPESRRALPEGLRRRIDRFAVVAGAPSGVVGRDAVTGRTEPPALRLELVDVSVHFGGITAVDTLTLEAATGVITGLIGPNGAGKTTTFNASSGLQRPSGGKVLLNGRDVTSASAAGRARAGLGRTFQQMKLCDSMTVRENVSLGAEASWAGANPLTHLLSTPSRKARALRRANWALGVCGLASIADRPAGALSTGQRRLVELARTVAGPFQLLLLDEPSSGLDRDETREFGALLKRIVADEGVGIFIVEHDMQLVADICDHIYVLDFGNLLFEGVPNDVMAAPVVRDAYLGTDTGGRVEAALDSRVP